ncbi:MAG: hypothetical protein SF029_10330 [bacterium]|nr:hypothetical protein [bacterium]
MGKRDFKSSVDLSFGESKSAIDPSFEKVDSAIFGDIAKVDARSERIQLVGIFEIKPDPKQPRRAIPSEVREQWNGNLSTIGELFDIWLDAIHKERGWPFPLDEHMLQQPDKDGRLEDPGPIETAFLQLIELAISIRHQKGLTNPITVIPVKNDFGIVNHYQLETGERRWLSYHLLNGYFDGRPGTPDERGLWSKIPAREMKGLDIWRQATENTARANLNAIARARQFALLMMDLLSRNDNDQKTFKPFEAFAHEREFYAQVADSRLPHGRSEQLLTAMGFTHRNAIKRYRDLLTLPNDVWKAADDTNCPESILRDLVNLTPKLAREQFNAWLAKERKNASLLEGETTDSPRAAASASESAEPIRLPDDPALKRGERLYPKFSEQQLVQTVKQLAMLHDHLGEATPETKAELKKMTAKVRRMLDQIDSLLY